MGMLAPDQFFTGATNAENSHSIFMVSLLTARAHVRSGHRLIQSDGRVRPGAGETVVLPDCSFFSGNRICTLS